MPDTKTPFPHRDESAEEEPTDRPMLDIDADLLAFLRTQVDSFVKWDLIQFFHRNPNTMDTAENVARYIGRRPESIHEEIVELSGGGLLTASKVNGMTIYSLSRESAVREVLRRFVESCDDQHFRVKAIYHILRAMR